MKKNLYYRTVSQRDNLFKQFLLSFFTFFSSPARLLLEVFIRKNFGERYFRLSSALMLAFTLAVLPAALSGIEHFYEASGLSEEPSEHSSFLANYLGWYMFLAAFVVVSLRHGKDQKRNPSVFDFAKYSLYRGRINPKFFKVQIPGRPTDVRVVECFIEPAFFFIAGLLLFLIGQKLGGLLLFCSICYGLSYVSDYIEGDNFVMDKIDEIISNQELEKSFVNDVQGDAARGFEFRGRKPGSQASRQQIVPLMIEEEEILTAG